MKHGVVVASPRAGITRDKYSANKSSHHPPRAVSAPRRSPPPPPPPRVIYRMSRGGDPRGRRQFLTSRAVYRRWPPSEHARGWASGRGTFDVFDARFISCHARAHAFSALSFSPPFFFFRFPFFALVLRYRSIFFAFFGRRWIARQLPIRIIWQEIPRAPVTVRHLCPRRPRRHSTSHFCFPSSLLRPGVSAAAIAIRSLTNLFDKSPRLIGLTTRPRFFFPSAKFTVVTRLLVAPLSPSSLKPFAFYPPNFSVAP